MSDYEGRFEGNSDFNSSNNNDYNSSSPPTKSIKHGGSDDHSDSKSQRGLRDHERESLKSKEKNRGKGRERDKERDKDGDREREREHNRHLKDHQRSRSDRREWSRSRDDNDDHHRHNSERRRDYDRERDVQQRHKSRSRSRDRSDHRSRSRSRSESKSKRTSGFDMTPASAMPAGGGAAATTAGQLIGTTPSMPGMFPNMFSSTPGQTFGTLAIMPPQQATRHARRVYVGGLPPATNEQSVATFFSHVMSTIGGNTAGPGDAVLNVYINYEKKFAFVEMRSVEEASNAMALDGIIFEGAPVKVRRPTDYNPSLAATLGPSQPNPSLNLAAVGLTPGSSGVLEGPDRIFVGGLPYYFTEAQIRELLESFGPLRGFDLVKDRETGKSKGYAFCVYQDLSVTDMACVALNGIKMGDKTLSVRRANQGASQTKPEHETVLVQAQQQIALQRLLFQGGAGAHSTKVVCLKQVVSADELRDDDEYEDMVEDMRGEGSKFGKLVNVVIPRPSPIGEPSPGVGKVFLEYADTDGAENALAKMNGRKFGGLQVVAVFYPENKFSQGEYDG